MIIHFWVCIQIISICRIIEHKSYDNAVASCMNECQGEPSMCGLASAAQLYSWIKNGVPKKFKGRYFRVNGLKVIAIILPQFFNFSPLQLCDFRLTVNGEYGTIWPTKTCSRTLVLNKWKCYLNQWVTMSTNCFLNLQLVMEGLDIPCFILLILKHWKLLHLGLNLQPFVGMSKLEVIL